MKSLLFDTNALVYWVYPGSPYHEEVHTLVEKAFQSDGILYALASSLTDVYYALHTNYTTEEVARSLVLAIAETFDLVDLAGPFVFEAIDSNEPDFEDGLIRTAAETLQVDAIVSYDKKAFHKSFIPRLTAQQAFELF